MQKELFATEDRLLAETLSLSDPGEYLGRWQGTNTNPLRFTMVNAAYNLIMDPSTNALRQLPKTVRFKFMMMLAFMWCAVFSIWTGWFVLFGPSMFAHAVILLGVFFTADVFYRANNRMLHHRDAMRNPEDGTALYDDLWGA